MRAYAWFFLVLVVAAMVIISDLLVAPMEFLRPTKKITTKQYKDCVPRKGIVVLNTLGLLANNLFEVAFANLLANDLCWELLIRPTWNYEIPSQRAKECFPYANLHRNFSLTPLDSTLQSSLNLTTDRWTTMADENESRADIETQNNLYTEWINALSPELVFPIHHEDANVLTRNEIETRFDLNLIVQKINSSSSVNVVDLGAFFIQYEWMAPRMEEIRRMLTIHDSCCSHAPPPPEAVVMHVREFEEEDTGHNDLKPAVYSHILRHYNLTDRPLWIVCQPKSVQSSFVLEILRGIGRSSDSVTFVPGQDQYDSFCTLTRATTLVLSYGSSYSAMGALLSNKKNLEVHNPVGTLTRPWVTLNVPQWKYHLVEDGTFDQIREFDIDTGRIEFVPG